MKSCTWEKKHLYLTSLKQSIDQTLRCWSVSFQGLFTLLNLIVVISVCCNVNFVSSLQPWWHSLSGKRVSPWITDIIKSLLHQCMTILACLCGFRDGRGIKGKMHVDKPSTHVHILVIWMYVKCFEFVLRYQVTMIARHIACEIFFFHFHKCPLFKETFFA